MALQAGISDWWANRFGGKFELQICHVPEILLLEKFLAGAIFASHTLLHCAGYHSDSSTIIFNLSMLSNDVSGISGKSHL